MMKKSLLMLLGALLAVPTFARDFTYTYEGQTLTYTVIDETAKTCKTKLGNDVSGTLIIPEIANGYKVTEIGDYALFGCCDMTSVTIPNSVTTIGYEAFANCRDLTSVTIPSSVAKIDGFAFSECEGLTSVIIGNSVTSIGEYAFHCCSGLTSVTIPNSVAKIDGFAFSECSGLMSVTIGNSVTEIGLYAFADCTSISEVEYPSSAPIEASIDIFEQTVYDNATLYVPVGSLTTFEKTTPWSSFNNIKEKEFSSAMEEIPAAPSRTEREGIYKLNGVKVGNCSENLAPGIYIVRQGSDTKKIAVE